MKKNDIGEPWLRGEETLRPAPVDRLPVLSLHLPPGIPMPDQSSPTWSYVFAFACAMEYKLSKNRKKGDSDGWRKAGASKLQDLLDREVEELNSALWDAVKPDKGLVLLEAADVANYAMMVADSVQNT